VEFSTAELLTAQLALMQWVAAFPVTATLLYFVCFVAVSALCLPGAAPLMLIGGACFGLTWCTLLANTASALGALLAMLATRLWLKEKLLLRFAKPIDRLHALLKQGRLSVLLGLRLAPAIPYPVLNIALAFTDVKAGLFFWSSFLGMLPGTFLYVNAGSQLGRIQSLNDVFTTPVVASLFALALLPYALQKLLTRLGWITAAPLES